MMAEQQPARSADVNVRTIAFWAMLIASGFGLWTLGKSFLPAALAFPASAAINFVVLVLSVAIGVWLARRVLRPVQGPARSGSWLAVMWGGSAACGIALVLNGYLGLAWSRSLGLATAGAWSAALSAPLNEEVAKLAGVVLLAAVSTRLVRSSADGLVLGALVGLGFQMVENFTYGLNEISSAGGVEPVATTIQSLVSRLTTGIGTHWTMSAIAGAGIGYLVSASGRTVVRRVAVAVGGLVLAMAMHWLFDSPFLPGTGGAIVKTLLNFALVMVVYAIVRRHFRARWDAVSDEEVEAGILTAEEAQSLSRRRSRRRYLRGFTAGAQREAQEWLQRSQLELVEERIPRRLDFAAAQLWREAVERKRPATRTLRGAELLRGPAQGAGSPVYRNAGDPATPRAHRFGFHPQSSRSRSPHPFIQSPPPETGQHLAQHQRARHSLGLRHLTMVGRERPTVAGSPA